MYVLWQGWQTSATRTKLGTGEILDGTRKTFMYTITYINRFLSNLI